MVILTGSVKQVLFNPNSYNSPLCSVSVVNFKSNALYGVDPITCML